ncbi:hypothetical protein MYCTH_2300706 [Thermothelomyces thermophilus ATCC 42464]|uniref:Uncharacterized protein n=1 Tax=Thermothelomyces thermophilus (strain ATCC 42464 / BCRC 31852 / DSM 1799) TaxID=573729 RepID=G2Q7Y2_THET4|nr:uncharacterized protein MYCTH_2300706 [Thermothelomyces thermophilus ATCC 42464]AEO56139.1 hypothetical protein MYCTH_2300706 [Thermothelomyces thermophilus ATCC 42464]
MSSLDPPAQASPPSAPPPSSSSSSSPSSSGEEPNRNQNRNPILHNAALAMAILCPVALVLPTRGGGRAKSTLQNAVLGGGAFWGVNQLAEDYTGKSITARSAERWGALLGVSVGGAGAGAGDGSGGNHKGDSSESSSSSSKVGFMHNLPTERAARNKELMEAERRRRAEAEGKEYVPKKKAPGSLWERLWMGGEEEGWKERRLEEERRAIESGKGYGDLIADQVTEVWRGKSGAADGNGGKDGKGNKKE